jgi:hypothetical protein
MYRTRALLIVRPNDHRFGGSPATPGRPLPGAAPIRCFPVADHLPGLPASGNHIVGSCGTYNVSVATIPVRRSMVLYIHSQACELSPAGWHER